MAKNLISIDGHGLLFDDIKKLVDESKKFVAAAVNSTLTMLNWKIGKRINLELLDNKRADYGKKIVVTLSRQLVKEYGSNFEEKNLRRMLQFASVFPDESIVVTLTTIKLVSFRCTYSIGSTTS